MLKDRRLHHITRLEYGRTHGWWVRFQRGTAKKGRYHAAQKMFSDGKYGSKAKAVRAAILWRDAELPKHPLRREFGKGKPRPLGTGYIKRGWRIYVHRTTGKRKRYPVWEGWIRLRDGKAAASSYSIPKWGEAAAKLLIQDWFSTKKRESKTRR